jgi:hypothetical protein
MPNEPQLRQLARQVIRSEKLPRRDPDRTWGGQGIGALCTVCEQPVTLDQTEYEVQFARDGKQSRLGQVPSPHSMFRGVGAGADEVREVARVTGCADESA